MWPWSALTRVTEGALDEVKGATNSPEPPQVTAGRSADREQPLSGIGELLRVVVPVIQRPHLFDEIGRVGAHAPLVAVRADFRIGVEVVQQHELAHDLVQVRRNALREQAKLRVTVALRQVAPHYVQKLRQFVYRMP